ncbi:radical SAM protein, partial [Enterococcus faecalis]|nr:radical SAM protein [Enterococcus faecalis]
MQRSRFMKLYFNNAFSIIKEDQHYFLFEKKDQKKITINEDMFHLLNEIQKLNGIDSDKYVEISSLIMELKEKNILTSISQLSCDNFFIKNYSVEMLFIELSKKCNLKCQHCYNESLYSIKDTLTTAELFKLIDQAKSLGIFKVQLTGGEPLLRKDIVD